MNDIKKLREMTGAGLADCKKALAESDDMDGAVAYLRKKGAAVAAKRSDRDAAEGCVLVKAENGFGAIIALKCETDFVANNADFVALTQQILDAAVANKCKTLDEVKAKFLVCYREAALVYESFKQLYTCSAFFYAHKFIHSSFLFIACF